MTGRFPYTVTVVAESTDVYLSSDDDRAERAAARPGTGWSDWSDSSEWALTFTFAERTEHARGRSGETRWMPFMYTVRTPGQVSMAKWRALAAGQGRVRILSENGSGIRRTTGALTIYDDQLAFEVMDANGMIISRFATALVAVADALTEALDMAAAKGFVFADE